MSAPGTLHCPRCGGDLVDTDPERLACAACGETLPGVHGVFDLRANRGAAVEPAPLRASDFVAAFRSQDEGLEYTTALEELLRSLSVVDADRLMQILGEGRGAWLTLLSAEGRELLFAGNALSGTVAALCTGGFKVSVLDLSLERARYGQWRNVAHGHVSARTFVGGDEPRLPFADRSFDVVVRESGFPRSSPPFAFGLDECRRVCRGELAVVGNNRFGYKRSTGRRSIHYVPGPVEYAAGALFPSEGERTLAAYRRAIECRDFEKPRTFALYPHASDFTHVVALDARHPSLTIGPKEKRNLLKVAARAIGLFSVLAPSFLLLSRSRTHRAERRRIERMLAEIAERIGEPTPSVERVISTRGQSSVIHTRGPGGGDTGPGWWTLHIPLSPATARKTARRHEALTDLRSRFPWLPVPEPLFHGRADEILLSCERRLGGRPAPQISGDRGCTKRMLTDVVSHFARLLVRPGARFSEADFESTLGSRFDIASEKAGVPATLAELARLRAEARERLVGKSLPRVFYHTDLRSKHVQVGQDGSVVGYLDWSTSEDEFLPYQDLFNLIVHERKQVDGTTAGEAWRAVRDRRDVRVYELETLDGYARMVGIDAETAQALEAIHPVLVAAMAERSWNYSLPFWLHRQFEL